VGLRTVDIVAPDPAWAAAFAAERARLAGVFGPAALVIEHIGSTAVPGLPAKPTIDIAAGFDDLDQFHRHRDQVEEFGYEYRPAAAFHAGHLFLRKVRDGERTHHLHVLRLPSADLDRYLALRDYLRSAPAAARRYGDAKQRLAADFYHDRRGYVAAKTAIITELLAEAGSPA
jgi:GrpB-like predicted nucleotidyltransferase (UPF0157 family)